MKILFDVGAHWGQDSIHIINNHPDWECWAFEPTPELARQLIEKTENIRDRYHVIQAAISDYDGMSEFNVVVGNTGSSSLKTFSDGLNNSWPGRSDFVVQEKIMVPVFRLDTWITLNAPHITQIDHLHIDAQGSDLDVLKGLGDKIGMVVSGVIEVPQSEEVKLYVGQHSKEDCIKFIQENGFEIDNVVSQQNEDNIYFIRKKQ